MKIVITGSLGHISRPLAQELIQKGHSVTIISSNTAKHKDIEVMGATAAIGSVEDPSFLAGTFTGADAAYCMTPPNFAEPDQLHYYERIAEHYAAAIHKSGIKKIVYLSSYGAHLPAGTGFITGSYRAEKILNAVEGIHLTHIRPAYFYYNLLGFIPMIKTAGFIGAVYGGTDRLPMVSPFDIAASVAEEITRTDSAGKVRYVVSDERSCDEIATLLGNAIGIPGLQWLVLPEQEVMASLIANGVPENAARNLVELGAATHTGLLREEMDVYKPAPGKLKLEDFVSEFSAAYQQ